MKLFALLLLLSSSVCFAGEVALTKSAILKGERTIVSLKAGTVVELLARDEKTLTVRYGKITGTIPATSITETGSAAETAKKSDPVPPRQATTSYGRAVEKAKENAAKHDKNLAKATDEILQ
ncbi:MAG TPA: hypothetical protein VGM64_02760 [Lacunisphaera sp.]